MTIGLVTACGMASAQAIYRMTDLGALGSGMSYGYALNARGQATGVSSTTSGEQRVFLWKNDGTPMRDLGTLGGTQSFLGSGRASGYSAPTLINASGQVTGYSFLTGDAKYHAFLWKNDGTSMLDLGTLGGTDSEGADINDSGQVTGDSYTARDATYHAFIWRNDGTPMQDLGTLGGTRSNGVAVDASGQVTGWASNAKETQFHPFIWKNDGTKMQDLGTFGGILTEPAGINASGQVAGYSDKNNFVTHAFLWKNDGTPIEDLGTLGGFSSYPGNINASGQVTGWSDTKKNAGLDAYIWKNDGTKMLDLGTLSGGTISFGAGINAAGQVVGYSAVAVGPDHAFLWRNDGTKMQDLNALIDPADPLKPYVLLESGVAINDAGQILVDGIDSRTGRTHAYLLQGSVLTLSPRSLAFGNQKVRTSSVAKSITMTNTSASAVPITSIALVGTVPGQFVFTDNCGKSLAGKATCTMKVVFKPTAEGAKAAVLKVNGGGGGLRSVKLTGTGTSPTAQRPPER
jgi:probable HAF family extracellular repeat protein